MTPDEEYQAEVRKLFVVFLENCDNELLRQTVRFNPVPEVVEAARKVLDYRKRQAGKSKLAH